VDRLRITVFVAPLLALIGTSAAGPYAHASPSPIPPATVVLSRTDRILIPPGWTSPELLFPRGRIDYRQVVPLLSDAVTEFTGHDDPLTSPWRNIATSNDKVAIQVDLQKPPVAIETINAIIDGLIAAGVSQDNIIVYARSETDLFAAGISVNPTGRGVRTMGSDSEGFRGGLSRIVLDYSTLIINVARLRAHNTLGMTGCVVNHLAAVPHTERLRLIADPAQLPRAAAHPYVRRKTHLHILEAYQPIIQDTGEEFPPSWEYRGLLMSADPVATDIVGMRILRAKLAQSEPPPDTGHAAPDAALTYLRAAGSNRFRAGQADPENITIKVLGTTNNILINIPSTDQ
jgi:hypothetical protein